MKRYLFIIFLVNFIALVLLFGTFWLIKLFGKITIEQFIFHLQFPLNGVDVAFIKSFIKRVLFPSLLISLFIVFLPHIINFLRKIYSFVVSFFKRHTIAFRFALSFIVLISSLVFVDKTFGVIKYSKNKIIKDYSSFYEENYISLNLDSKPKKLNNLIVILAESIESTYSSKNIPTIKSNGGGRITLHLVS